MALKHALSALSLATVGFAIPSALATTSGSSICATSSQCIPFTIDVTWGTVNPTNGAARNGILTNGSFPGPALKLKVGECVDFVVINNLPNNTGVHFHGINQVGTPWADGTPGLSQWAIKPGDSYMYQWTADEPGSYFYHSHYKGQIADGLYGAIQIEAADGADKPFGQISSSDVAQLEAAESKIEPILVSDWTSFTFGELYGIEQAANIDIACSDSIILNGLGSVYCLTRAEITALESPAIPQLLGNGSQLTNKGCIPANNFLTQGNYTRNLAAVPPQLYDQCTPSSNQNYTYTVDPADGWAAITFISPAAFETFEITIDSHKLYVFMYNGQYIQPQVVDRITVSNGERVSFFIQLNQPVGDYTIRVANSGLNQLLSGFGVLSYKGATGPAASAVALMDYGGNNHTAIVDFNDAEAAPYPAIVPSPTADKTFLLDIEKLPNSSFAYEWVLSGQDPYAMSRDDQQPLLFQNPASIPDIDIILKTNMGEWIDLVIRTTGPVAQPHPIHKHANKFFHIGAGIGTWEWASVAEAQAAGVPFNLQNPTYADGAITVPTVGNNTWMVLRYKVEIPGAWFLHCHIQTHFSGGMGVAILDGVDAFPTVPSDVGKVCPGTGVSNSTWVPSCYCPASCAGNGGSSSSSGSGNATSASGSGSGSWNGGTWTGPNNPAVTNASTSSVAKAPSTTSSGPVGKYTGSASSTSFSLLTVIAFVAVALSL